MTERRMRLKEEHTNDTSVVIDVSVNESGDLVLAGQDIGAAPTEIFGDSDYEYWVTVRAADRDAVLLQLLVERFDDDRDFMEWLKARAIPYEFFSH
jgi:hypothetical protein